MKHETSVPRPRVPNVLLPSAWRCSLIFLGGLLPWVSVL